MEKETLYKYFEGTATLEEEAAIYRWLDISPDHEKELFREREFFDTTILSGKIADWEKAERKIPAKTKSLFIHPVIREILKIAAVVAITIACGLFLYVSEKQQLLSAMNTITVPVGQRVSLKLPDGTVVWLNARSEMVYPSVFSDSRREVQLDGEAYFEVKHNGKRPFVVHTQKCNIEVLGTKFNVEAYSDSDDFSTSLMEGSVKVTGNVGQPDPVLLEPNQEVQMKDGKLFVSSIGDFDQFRWREGLVCFRKVAFHELMKRFEKCYGLTIIVENEHLKEYYCSGKFRVADGLDNALRILQRDAKYTFERNEDNTVVYIK